MDTKHTPGPWRAERMDIWPGVKTPGSALVAQVHFREDQEEGEANARLIAAAPELLAAIQPLRDALARAVGGFELAVRGCPVRDMTETIHEARAADKQAAAALAKAEGR